MIDFKPPHFWFKGVLAIGLVGFFILPSACLKAQPEKTVEGKLRPWTFRNGDVEELRLKNAYGKTAYFGNKKGGTIFANILTLAPADQAEVVYWSRIRDAEIFQQSDKPTEFQQRFKEDAFKLEDSKLIKNEWQQEEGGPEFYAIYTSAGWCVPCRGFTPKLVSFYDSTKDFYQGQYEIVLCSWDETQGEMIEYMMEEKMNWFGNWKNRKSSFWRKYQGNGIPCLVVVDRNGFILTNSYNSEGYLGPGSALDDFREILTHAAGDQNTRVSVPTPGIDLAKLNKALLDIKKEAKLKNKAVGPSLVYSPKELLGKLENPEAEPVELKMNFRVTPRGVVTGVQLPDNPTPALQLQLEKALILWQFLPAVNADGEEEVSVVNLPLSLRLKKEFQPNELGKLD